MSVLLNFAMFPIDTGESKSESVSKVIELVRDSGVKYELNPMGTCVEAPDMDTALDLINKAYKVLEPYHNRIYANISIDVRKNSDDRMTQKINSVESKIGKVEHK